MTCPFWEISQICLSTKGESSLGHLLPSLLLIQVTELDLLAIFVKLVPLGDFFMQIPNK